MQSFAHFSLFCASNLRVMKKNIRNFCFPVPVQMPRILSGISKKTIPFRFRWYFLIKSDAYVLERAHRLGVPCNVFPKEDWIAGDEILAILQEYRIDFVVLAGFLVRVPDLLLHAYPDKIINIHPALLPRFGGKGMYGDRVHEAVVAAGEKESGITIHYINEHYDEGNAIFQATCPVLPTDSPDDVAKVHALEYEHFPQVIEQVLRNKY